jgi:hypothetical protein
MRFRRSSTFVDLSLRKPFADAIVGHDLQEVRIDVRPGDVVRVHHAPDHELSHGTTPADLPRAGGRSLGVMLRNGRGGGCPAGLLGRHQVRVPPAERTRSGGDAARGSRTAAIENREMQSGPFIKKA